MCEHECARVRVCVDSQFSIHICKRKVTNNILMPARTRNPITRSHQIRAHWNTIKTKCNSISVWCLEINEKNYMNIYTCIYIYIVECMCVRHMHIMFNYKLYVLKFIQQQQQYCAIFNPQVFICVRERESVRGRDVKRAEKFRFYLCCNTKLCKHTHTRITRVKNGIECQSIGNLLL